MDFKDLKNKTEDELKEMLSEYKGKLVELRFKDSNHQLKNVREIRQLKKDIARILTALSQQAKQEK